MTAQLYVPLREENKTWRCPRENQRFFSGLSMVGRFQSVAEDRLLSQCRSSASLLKLPTNGNTEFHLNEHELDF